MEKILDSAKTPVKEQTTSYADFLQKGLAFGVLVLLSILFGVLTKGNFLRMDNLLTVALQVTPYAILGFGLTFVLITGGTDLSAGSVLGFGGIVCAKAITMGVPMWLAIIGGITVGALAGAINGFAVTQMNVTPFIATLGTQFAFRGLTQLAGQGKPVSIQSMDDKAVVETFKFLGGGSIGRVPFPTIIMLAIAILLGIVLSQTGFGRRIYAVGSNEEAARLSGINVFRTKMSAYIISGATAACAGILLAARLASAQSNAGQSYELEGIAAAVIGGTSVMGGEGSILGTIIGAFVMGVLRNGLNLVKVDPFVQMIIIGAIIVVGVWYDTLRRKSQSL
ncbi:ABC transporter permease [Oscillospiraceae bacterium MB08-C2-2]|nr:ABC transporter permease [Oscillospiraceae bacterium MB08-C2-2]